VATGGSITSGTGLAAGTTIHTFSAVGASQFTIDGTLAGPKLNGTLSGTGGFTWNSALTLTLNADNTYAGGTVISSGVVQVGNGGGTGSIGTGNVTNNASLVINRSTAYTIPGAISGTGSLMHAGSGTTTLTGANSYTGATTIAAGRLIGSAASLPGAIANAAELEFAQAAAGTFAAAITGTGSFTKTGGGNLILSGSSSYSGATSVAAGRLSVNGILGDTPVAVLAAAELGGSGSITGPVSIDGGGTLSPGNSIASLASGTASFAAAATFAYEVDSTNPLSLGAAADLLVVSGDLNLDSGNASLLTLADLASSVQPFVEDTTIFAMINYSGAWNGGLFTYGGNVLSDGERFYAGSQMWEIDYNRTSSAGLDNFTADYLPSSSFVTVTAVPEPSTLVLMAIGAGVAAVAARQRHASGRHCRTGG
jgi:autotransporter-associated beta strand protein